ncbi:sigma-54 interaction domain-containing protein [Peribacillus asahii]|uniref:sigma-54 interaction domain-containing protein n=1 Tax=Peribacillus asahii TaxID=228899 RepID=UPI00207ABEBE|nr:sigma 54-interacting transcriptional regulator [Peribacillus asahii]USK59257.1 sigma 54-interacting transcriptional regulator [Peribacillus asahii]
MIYKRDLELYDFERIADILYDGIYIADKHGKTVFVNKAYERITGLKREQVVGKYVGDLIETGLFNYGVTPDVIKTKKQINATSTIHNGVTVLITGTPLFNNKGEVELIVVTNRDMSDLLRIENELKKSKEQMKIVEKTEEKNIQEIEHLRKKSVESKIIGESEEIKNIIQMINQVAKLDVNVLITGETGVGKEVVSNEIYMNSNRHNKPFIKVNCAAIPANLLEAELFGYEKGAFTGASTKGKLGLFELANHGTILLDEIADMPMDLQVKLLRVIQQREITRIGGTKPVRLDVRIIAATHGDLKELVSKGKFREDLYYRLYVFPIYIPPLRVRISDIEKLTGYFLTVYNNKYGKEITFEKDALLVWESYSWPGNIRELQNVLERLVIISNPSEIITSSKVKKLLNIEMDDKESIDSGESYKRIIESFEKKVLQNAIDLYGTTRKVAEHLKIDQSTVVKKAKKLGIKLKKINN